MFFVQTAPSDILVYRLARFWTVFSYLWTLFDFERETVTTSLTAPIVTERPLTRLIVTQRSLREADCEPAVTGLHWYTDTNIVNDLGSILQILLGTSALFDSADALSVVILTVLIGNLQHLRLRCYDSTDKNHEFEKLSIVFQGTNCQTNFKLRSQTRVSDRADSRKRREKKIACYNPFNSARYSS
jgi:hypothetical protein